jgi:tellurium resistance protein TerD
MELYKVVSNKVKIGIEAHLNLEADFDISVFLLGENNKLISENHLLYYGSPVFEKNTDYFQSLPDRSIYFNSSKDIKSGKDKEFDELFFIDFSKINELVKQIKFIIHLYHDKGQGSFGNEIFTKKCNFNIKILDINKNDILSEFNLNGNYSKKGAVGLIDINKKESNWQISESENSYEGKLPELLKIYT